MWCDLNKRTLEDYYLVPLKKNLKLEKRRKTNTQQKLYFQPTREMLKNGEEREKETLLVWLRCKTFTSGVVSWAFLLSFYIHTTFIDVRWPSLVALFSLTFLYTSKEISDRTVILQYHEENLLRNSGFSSQHTRLHSTMLKVVEKLLNLCGFSISSLKFRMKCEKIPFNQLIFYISKDDFIKNYSYYMKCGNVEIKEHSVHWTFNLQYIYKGETKAIQ